MAYGDVVAHEDEEMWLIIEMCWQMEMWCIMGNVEAHEVVVAHADVMTHEDVSHGDGVAHGDVLAHRDVVSYIDIVATGL